MRIVKVAAVSAALVAGATLGSGVAAAAPPPSTPAGTGGGCQANGQAISGAARGPGVFGAVVREAAPIADENALFFTRFCAGNP